jgi:hypothetical protein
MRSFSLLTTVYEDNMSLLIRLSEHAQEGGIARARALVIVIPVEKNSTKSQLNIN